MHEVIVTNHDPVDINYFGECPECGRNDGYINVGAGHWYLCERHKTKWFIGSNLFSSWQEETEDDQRALYHKIGMGFFLEVKGVHDEELIRRLRQENPAEEAS